MSTEDKTTETARRRWNRTALFYDLMQALSKWSRWSKWEELLWSKVESSDILEIAVGTGKNFAYYPAGAEITAIDFSPKMLKRAKDRAKKQKG